MSVMEKKYLMFLFNYSVVNIRLIFDIYIFIYMFYLLKCLAKCVNLVIPNFVINSLGLFKFDGYVLGCFMCPLKNKFSSCNVVQNLEVVYSLNYHCKISRQSVHKWHSSSTLKFKNFRKFADKWRFFCRLMFYPSSLDVNNVYIRKQEVWHQH